VGGLTVDQVMTQVVGGPFGDEHEQGGRLVASLAGIRTHRVFVDGPFVTNPDVNLVLGIRWQRGVEQGIELPFDLRFALLPRTLLDPPL
jgi:hypothetical protein